MYRTYEWMSCGNDTGTGILAALHQNVRPVILYIVYSLCVSFSDGRVTNVNHFHWQFVGTLYFTVYCVRASDGIVSILNDICDLSSRNLV